MLRLGAHWNGGAGSCEWPWCAVVRTGMLGRGAEWQSRRGQAWIAKVGIGRRGSDRLPLARIARAEADRPGIDGLRSEWSGSNGKDRKGPPRCGSDGRS